MADTKPILVPLDGSKLSEYALPIGAWYSKATGAPLKFLHVVDGGRAEAQAKAAETFQTYAAELAARVGLNVPETMVLAGNASEQILSASVSASAIALASHGRGGFRAMIRGSVADKVFRGADVPVLVEPGTEVPPAEPTGDTILVGLDGSEAAERGLEAARELAKVSGVSVTLLHTYSMPPAAGIEFASFPADYAPQIEAAAQSYATMTALPGEQTIVRMGDPTTAILEAAEETHAILIVLTKSGKGTAARFTLGSTTDRVIHGTERPVLVIPPTDE